MVEAYIIGGVRYFDRPATSFGALLTCRHRETQLFIDILYMRRWQRKIGCSEELSGSSPNKLSGQLHTLEHGRSLVSVVGRPVTH